MPPKPFTPDDVTFCFENKLACRHVSGDEAYRTHLREPVLGDAYAIGAANILTYSPEERVNDFVFDKAHMEHVIAAMTGKGLSDRDAVINGGETLLTRYKNEIRNMVTHAVDYDDRHGRPEECHLIIYNDILGVASPYDLDRYPFGKTGHTMLNPGNACGGVFLDEHERGELKGNRDAVIGMLTEKLLSQLHTLRERDDLKQKDTGPRQV
jgi:hypothetical protein